jgi:hypothetical protein
MDRWIGALLFFAILEYSGIPVLFNIQPAFSESTPGVDYRNNLPKKKRSEIRVLNNFSVEVGLGADGKSVSSNILDAVRSIPLVKKGKEPKQILFDDKIIYRQKKGYSTDRQGRKKVKLTSKYIRSKGKILISLVRPKEIETRQKKEIGKQKPASPPKAETQTQQPSGGFIVEGYRSARFGMNRKEIIAAVKNDFGISTDKIKSETNENESTISLNVDVPNLLPGAGLARVIYILGHESNSLVQVNIVWGAPFFSDASDEAIVQGSALLRNYFFKKGFEKNRINLNKQLKNGDYLIFRATEEEGRAINLILKKIKKNQKSEKPRISLILSYLANHISPDIKKKPSLEGLF